MPGDHDRPLVVEAAGRELSITHPEKVLFPEIGQTKGDLVGYYQSVAEPLLRAVGGRPVMLQRFPDGPDGPSFFQKRVPANRPAWLESTTVSTPNGTTSEALVLADLAHVLWAVNLACLGFHAWAGGQVSTPFGWDELETVDPDSLTMLTVPGRLASGGDPWKDASADPQSLEPLLALHHRDVDAGLSDAPWPPVYPKMPGEPPRVAPSRAKGRARS